MNFCPDTPEKLLARNLHKSFDDLRVIEGVTLSLREKEFVSVLGLSGSGKTTIFNLIAGLLLPDAGEIIIDGKDCTGMTGRVGYMYQKDLLLPWKTIIDNVSLPLVIRGESRPKARERVGEYFEIFGLKGFERKYPFQLSGGMRQRAALMRTFFFHRDIMLLDEPFGGLDAITRSRMHTWLMEVLSALDAAVLLITHDIEEAVFLSDRIYILTDRPARVKEEIIIEFPRPRERGLVTTEEFNAVKRRILDIL